MEDSKAKRPSDINDIPIIPSKAARITNTKISDALSPEKNSNSNDKEIWLKPPKASEKLHPRIGKEFQADIP